MPQPFPAPCRRSWFLGLASALAVTATPAAPPAAAAPTAAPPLCSADTGRPVATNFDGCAALQARVEDVAAFRGPQGFRLDAYEAAMAEFLGRYCHRNPAAGWQRDKRVRDTGPFFATLAGGAWSAPASGGTHAPVVVWYSDKMMAWLRTQRPASGAAPAQPTPVPDGAIMVKEMFPPPAARCADVPPEQLAVPAATGVAFMVRDQRQAHDGWFWGAWWPGFTPDWPAQAGNGLQAMGHGAYCLNCHASAATDNTFASLANIRGEPGEPHVYLSQNFLFDAVVGAAPPRHRAALAGAKPPAPHTRPLARDAPGFERAFGPAPAAGAVVALPSQTYDHTWVPGGGPTSGQTFLTADQCVGCHAAGSTGLQFDMTEAVAGLDALLNWSPYGSWRTSPMGLAGRDPVFYAQLASETETFHPTRKAMVETVCLGCHAVQGERQYQTDRVVAAGAGGDATCDDFSRAQLAAVPYPSDPARNPQLASAPYAALGRDGVGCTVCHRMALTDAQVARVRDLPQNHCALQRQQQLNPGSTGFARSFTGSFLVGPADELGGPFAEPKTRPMAHALGMRPVHDRSIRSSELCGTCHTVHLPVFARDGRPLGHVYEQTTFPEWAFSAYRTGTDVNGAALPSGRGNLAQSCQGCHMQSADPATGPFRSKIASIQERSNFPETEHVLPAADIDLDVREGFARHTLVGLNLFLVKMAQQFPALLGLPAQDPMLGSHGLAPALQTERAIVEQARDATATVTAAVTRPDAGTLRATVTVTNLTGHKLPSGVGFRRAFLAFEVLDEAGRVLWASGRTDDAGALVDARGRPLPGEYWWSADCAARVPGTAHQPHRQTISAQDQAQVYQELVVAPADVPEPRCGPDPVPGGQLTTSFLSICGRVKDNRLLPQGFLPEPERVRIAQAMGAGPELAREVGPDAVGDDPDYVRGGGDSVDYVVDLTRLKGKPASVRATLYSQSTPPSYLQDRFCTSRSEDTQRLRFIAGRLDLSGSRAAGWKLEIAGSGRVAVP